MSVRIASLLFLMLAATTAWAQGGRASERQFGIGAPFTLGDLPPGRMADHIARLPAPAQARAMDWLRRFSFPAADLPLMRVDPEGGVLYRDDPIAAIAGAPDADAPAILGASLTAAQTFSLHSRPGADNVVYLDFDGHVISATAWNSTHPTLTARPYDLDGDPGGFSQTELDRIAEIWHRVAEDFAPFDIDVTTELPASFGPTTARVVITRDDDASGIAMPYAGAGGVAYINVWGRTGSYDYQYYSPALVYYDNLGGGQARFVAEAVSHELGHNLALSHDGTDSVTYYSGHNAGPSGGYIDWAPIMGSSYGADVTQWSKGDYAGANNAQDDIAEIVARLGHRPDDHGDVRTEATALLVDGAGNVTSTNPETDPFGTVPGNKGVLETGGDVDVFAVSVAAGLIDLTVRPAWDAYYDDASRGANLDVNVALYDASGNLLVQDQPGTETDARIATTVPAGVYYLAVSGAGAGSPTNSYDAYGSAGMYFIDGQVSAGEPNAAPVAVDDAGTTAEDSAVAIEVLANDRDDDGDPLSLVNVSSPAHGSAALDGDRIRYVPDTDFNGQDAFDYVISDGLRTATARVTVTVTPVNDLPVATDDTAQTVVDTDVTIDVLANDQDADGDPLQVVPIRLPANGTVTTSGGGFVYRPDAGFVGTDSFDYAIDDGAGGSDAASVVVTVVRPVVVPPMVISLGAVDGTDGSATVSWAGSEGADYYEVQRETRHKKRNSWNGRTAVGSTDAVTLTLTDRSGTGTFRYQVRAGNAAGASAWSPWVIVTVTEAGGGGGGGGGSNGKGRGRNK